MILAARCHYYSYVRPRAYQMLPGIDFTTFRRSSWGSLGVPRGWFVGTMHSHSGPRHEYRLQIASIDPNCRLLTQNLAEPLEKVIICGDLVSLVPKYGRY
jgi:hypothetical protein